MPRRPTHPGDPTAFERGPTGPDEPRQLILAAMVRLTGTRGYREVDVADVLDDARVPAAVFESHFEGKRDCFLAAYEAVLDQLREEILAECDANLSWTTRMRIGLAGILDRFAADPGLARVATVESAVVGTEALRLYFDTVSRLGEFVDAGRETRTELPEQIAVMAVGGVAGLIADEVAGGRAEQLPSLLPSLLYALLLPYVGPDTATAEMRLAAGLY
jgi:AcrR family transcriptional regulator